MRYGNKCPPAVVLVVGANGFLGGYLVAALRQEGFTVIKGVRSPNAFDERVCDFSNLDVQSARDAVKGVDCVVNAAGILRETGKQTFQDIHVDGPTLLVHACIENNITQFIAESY